MRTHIDWLTFTFTPEYADASREGYAEALGTGLRRLLGDHLANLLLEGGWGRRARSRAPYSDAREVRDIGVTLFSSPNLTHATIEISGQGCEALIERGILNEILTSVVNRVTRIDIACDIETDVKPIEFVACLTHERMRSSGYQISETGQTSYVGSKKSDRYARVYRYAQPHPRSHLLRIEHVFRRAYSKVVANACVTGGERSAAIAAGKVFGWSHSVWDTEGIEPSDISIVSSEKNMGGTVFWLIKQCAPAFRRMVREGVIHDPEAFCRTYFLQSEA